MYAYSITSPAGSTSHFDVTEDKYREDGYQPPFEELPWKPESVAPDLAPLK